MERRTRKEKSKVIASSSYLEEKFQKCRLAIRVETLGVDLRTRTKQLGAKEKARRNTCDVWFSIARRTRVVPEELHEDWCEEAVEEGGLVPARM